MRYDIIKEQAAYSVKPNAHAGLFHQEIILCFYVCSLNMFMSSFNIAHNVSKVRKSQAHKKKRSGGHRRARLKDFKAVENCCHGTVLWEVHQH